MSGLLGRLGLDSLRRSGVERLLEVRLDLGVVGGEDAVAGVRGLPVDRPPRSVGWGSVLAQSGSVRRCWPQV